MEQELHVVFGAGQVGPPLAELLINEGKRVRIVRRSSKTATVGAELMTGDAADPAFCRTAAQGASVLYHCMNPPYDIAQWTKLIPLYTENLIGAAGKAGARLVVLDSLYMLGRTHGRPMNEDTPIDPCSKKGELKARASQRLLDAHRKGEVHAVAGRAADFYGPGAVQSFMGDYFWPAALKGRKVWSPVTPTAVHTYHYIPDVAAGLATLAGASDEDFGKAWMLPCQPAGTLADLAGRFSTVLGRPIAVGGIPPFLMKMLGKVVPIAREIGEMLYQWEEPFVVDDRRFRERFHLLPVAADEAAQETVQWAKKAYA